MALRPLSFSEVERSGGCGRAIWEERRRRPSRKRFAGRVEKLSPAQAIGIWAHAALESVVNSTPWPESGWEGQLDDAWEVAWDGLPLESGAHWSRQPGGFLVRMTVEAWLSDRTVRAAAGQRAEAEVAVSSPDGLVGGRADVLLESGSGTVEVWDLKTGEPGRGIAEDARTQLELYAGLLMRAGRNVQRIGMLGNMSWALEPLDHDSADRMVERFSSVAEVLAGGGQPPAFPSTELCLRCPWLADCSDGLATLEPFTSEVELVSLRRYVSGVFMTYEDGTELRSAGPLLVPGSVEAPAGPVLLIRVDEHPPRVVSAAKTDSGAE